MGLRWFKSLGRRQLRRRGPCPGSQREGETEKREEGETEQREEGETKKREEGETEKKEGRERQREAVGLGEQGPLVRRRQWQCHPPA